MTFGIFALRRTQLRQPDALELAADLRYGSSSSRRRSIAAHSRKAPEPILRTSALL
jgi:hypothetical protein